MHEPSTIKRGCILQNEAFIPPVALLSREVCQYILGIVMDEIEFGPPKVRICFESCDSGLQI